MKEMPDEIQAIIGEVLEDFRQPDALDRVALHIIPPTDRPCGKWSFLNRWIVRVNKSEDARGMKQWGYADRRVKKGAKALYILAPRIIQKQEQDPNTGEKKTARILVGFMRIPVFRMEDTDGKPVEYPGTDPSVTPPLLGVAKSWGLDVRYSSMLQDYSASGLFNGETGEIILGSHDPHIFFHELAHAAHQKIGKQKLKGGSDPKQEIIAEFAAAILMRMYGYKGVGNAYDYISRYAAATDKKDVMRSCMTVLSTTEKVVKAILATEQGEPQQEEANA